MWFKAKKEVKADPHAIEDFLTRAVSGVYPNRQEVSQMLSSGKQLSMYLGIDPTGPTLHLGHAIAIRKLRAFQKMGHKVILLIGSFTAQIGDPTDKLAARVRLTEEQVLANAALYKKQASALLDFEGSNPAEIRYNGTWLSPMTLSDVVDLASKTTVQEMLKRDMFETRMKEGKPIHLHEFLYPLLQGYDSVAMQIDGEVGGNDQLFNMLTGRDLVRAYLDKEKFVLTMKLLADSSGKKMGKTEGNMAALSDAPAEVFGKVMSWTDGMILSGFELCTDRPTADLKVFEERLQKENPRDIKLELAEDIVRAHFGEKAAKASRESFTSTFSSAVFPEDALSIKVTDVVTMRDFVVKVTGGSNSEATRLFEQRAIENEQGEKITDPSSKPTPGNYRIGKRHFGKLE